MSDAMVTGAYPTREEMYPVSCGYSTSVKDPETIACKIQNETLNIFSNPSVLQF